GNPRDLPPFPTRRSSDLFSGTTVNVARLALDLAHLPPGPPVRVELDGQKLDPIPWPAKGTRVWLARSGEKWSAAGEPSPALKGPDRKRTRLNSSHSQISY